MQEVNSSQIFSDEQPEQIEVTLQQFDELVLDKEMGQTLIDDKPLGARAVSGVSP